MVCSPVKPLVGIVALVLLPESYRCFGSKNLLFVGNPIFSLSLFAVLRSGTFFFLNLRVVLFWNILFLEIVCFRCLCFRSNLSFVAKVLSESAVRSFLVSLAWEGLIEIVGTYGRSWKGRASIKSKILLSWSCHGLFHAPLHRPVHMGSSTMSADPPPHPVCRSPTALHGAADPFSLTTFPELR
jgi:hypothetical protein